jgi:hypothetical protein
MDDQQKQTSNINTAVAATVSSAATVVSAQKTMVDRGKNLDKSFAEQQQAQMNSNTKKLVDALVSLKKPFADLAKQKPARTGDGKGTTGIAGAIGGTIKGIIKDKLSPITNLTSKEGILQTLATISGGGLSGMIAGGALEKFQVGKEEEKRKEDFKKAYLESTPAGKRLVKSKGEEEATREVEKLYNEKLELEKQIAELKTKQKQAQATGVVGADLSKEEQKELAAKEKRLGIVMGGPARISKKAKEEPDRVSRVSKAAETRDAIQAGSTPESFEHLVEVNEEQLDSLKRIVAAVTETQEDKLEKRKKVAKVEIPQKEGKKEEKGFMGSPLEKLPLGDLLSKTKIGGALATGARTAGGALATGARALAPVAAKAALPVAAVAGAGYAGYKAGGLLNDYVLNPAAAAITGNEDETLGGAIYSGVDKVKGMLGFQTDQKKMELADRKAVEELYNKQMMERGSVSPYLAKEMEKYGVKTPDTLIKKKPPVTPSPVIATEPAIQLPEEDLRQTRLVDEKIKQEYQTATPEERAQIQKITGMTDRDLSTPLVTATPVATPPVAPSPAQTAAAIMPIMSRAEEQTNILRERTAAVEEGKQQKPIIVAMPGQPSGPAVINNSTNTTIVRPETRSPEPTFNKILTKNFLFA